MLESITDDALIKRYVQNNDTHAFDVLTLRHRDAIYWRFYKSYPEQADDLTQDLLEKLLRKLHLYKAEGNFSAYLKKLVNNMLIDHWRWLKNKTTISEDNLIINLADVTQPDTNTEDGEQLEYIFHTLIPELPCKQRMVYLLMQESNFWEGMQKLSWNDLAILNGISPNEAALRFFKARDALFKQQEIGCEDMLILFVWTQCQRLDKKTKLGMSYFADLLNINIATFKSRERKAKKQLTLWINRWNRNEC